jgi:hypothetical protein
VLGDLLAIARGLSSTWAGLASAETETMAALDPAADQRHWFAFVAGAADERGPSPRGIQVRSIGGGLAVRIADASLADARASLAPLLLPGVNVTLYPIDD